MSDWDCLVIGGGVVGLACAARLSADGLSVLLVDRHAQAGQETSSRNSGVIHAGIYYPTGSLKAQLCVQGRELLYRRCRDHGLAHRKIGKLIVAGARDEVPRLQAIQQKAADNGVELTLVEGDALAKMEPNLAVAAGLWSPETGIVDVHELMADYQREAVEGDASICYNTTVVALEHSDRGWTSRTESTDGEVMSVRTRRVVNAGGLHADKVAQLAGLDVAGQDLTLSWCKGDYFVLASRHARSVSHLIYPLPVHAGLGVHLTFDLGGRLIAGPDTQYVDELNYRVDPDKSRIFAEAVCRYFRGVTAEDLTPGYAGIRPKLQGPGEPVRDFVIEEASAHGLPGLVNLIGIESPGLTASEAIAARVASLVAG